MGKQRWMFSASVGNLNFLDKQRQNYIHAM